MDIFHELWESGVHGLAGVPNCPLESYVASIQDCHPQ